MSRTWSPRESSKAKVNAMRVNTGKADWRLLIARPPAGRESKGEGVCVCVERWDVAAQTWARAAPTAQGVRNGRKA